jgi:hypothetical protein
MSNGHSAVREGAVAGAIGAAILAGWYFVVDVAHGQPFRTPLLIAQLLFGGVGSDAGSMGAIVIVTIVHFTAIMVVGVGLVALVHLAARELEWRMALIIAMAVALVLFFGLGYAAHIAQGQPIPYWVVFTGGLLAVLGISWYLWRGHPGLARSFRDVPLGDEGESASHAPER